MHSEEQWERVLARDPEADGRFVYAVRSTGIYCRPTCPSRRPLRRHVRFFPDGASAERAGFRPCRRCHGAPERDWPAIVRRACALLADDTGMTLGDAAAQLGVGPFQLQRRFKAALGITPRDFAAARRAGRLKELLARREPVTSALYEAGYGSSSRLYEKADEELGMTPATYRRGGASMHIHYTVVPSPLGRLLVAATDRGVCSIKLGDAAAGLIEDLRREYPARRSRTTSGSCRQPSPRFATSSRARACAWTCRSTSRARSSSGASGTTCAGFHLDARSPTGRSRGPSASREPHERSRKRARRITPRWSSRATVSCKATAHRAATTGERRARRSCSSSRVRRTEPRNELRT